MRKGELLCLELRFSPWGSAVSGSGSAPATAASPPPRFDPPESWTTYVDASAPAILELLVHERKTEVRIAESFRGKSRVQQHQLVYEALKGQMGGALHALALQTGIPNS